MSISLYLKTLNFCFLAINWLIKYAHKYSIYYVMYLRSLQNHVMSTFAKILRYQHSSFVDNESTKIIIINIRVKRVQTIYSFETILSFMYRLRCLLINRYAYSKWLSLFKTTGLINFCNKINSGLKWFMSIYNFLIGIYFKDNTPS